MNEVLEEALKNLYDGVSISDMRTSLVMSARTKVEKEQTTHMSLQEFLWIKSEVRHSAS